DQFKHLLGLSPQGTPAEHFLVRFWSTIIKGGPVNPWSLAIGIGTIGLVLGLRRLNREIVHRTRVPVPELLLPVICMAAIVWAFNLDALGVAIVGHVPAALPRFQLPAIEWSRVQQLAGSSLAIAVLGLLEAIAMAKSLCSLA